MTNYQNIIIGFGKAGKTLAVTLSNMKQTTLLIEQDPKMHGGTCINVGCIPSKTLAYKADKAIYFEDKEAYYKKSMNEMHHLIESLNQANTAKVQSANVTIVTGHASFIDEHTLLINKNGTITKVTGDRIFINTGATPVIPQIEGCVLSDKIHNSESLLSHPTLPRHLLILGAGFIGLEFATTYAKFGSQVTLIDSAENFLPKEDRDIAQSVLSHLKELGINYINPAKVTKIEEEKVVTLTYEKDGQVHSVKGTDLLVAVGRKPNIHSLKLENANVTISDSQAIEVNEFCQTSKPHIYAMGDCRGGSQFTYISLDDYRVVLNHLLMKLPIYSLNDRNIFPTVAFLHPPLAKVGLSESEAKKQYSNLKVATLPAMMIPNAKVLGETTGLYKVIVDLESNLIVGATLFASHSHEVINMIDLAIKEKIPYTSLKNHIFTHPTMSEALNDVFGLI